MKIETILIVGAGTMGRGIAYVASIGGYKVILNDVSNEALKSATKSINYSIIEGVNRGKITSEEGEESKNRIEYSSDIEYSSKKADFVIEAVPEVMDLKKNIFQQLNNFTKKDVVLATNTSAKSPTEIGSFTDKPDKVIAMHFFNPVPKMKLIEVIKGLETSEETVDIIQKVSKKMRKDTVIVNEFPGFVTSRISALVGNEAFNMLMEGVGTAEEIDKAIELGLNFPMGPFKLGDIVGLDVRLNNLKYMHESLGENYRPSPLLVKYVQAGRLGVKTNKGVYEYE